MSEVKEPAIKLFGRTISLPLSREFAANGFSATADSVNDCSHQSNHSSSSSPPEEQSSREARGDDIQEASRKELTSVQEEDVVASHQTTEDAKSPTNTTATASSGIFENPKTPSAGRETSLPKSSKNEEQSETNISQEKTLKKPDKILPCPRCNSMDTKFCYYNNYNVKQPRHFCKNCQRYWTAGGTMRNVPVGAGRRKNKNSSAPHYRQIMVQEGLQTAKVNGLHNSVLTFASDSPLCNSMASVLNLAEKTKHGFLNRIHVPEENIIVSSGGEDNGDNYSIGASVTASTSSEKRGNAGVQELLDKNYKGHSPKVPCFPRSTWPYPSNSALRSSPTSPPAIFPAGFSVSFYPTPAYWGCTVPATWNTPCISLQSSVTNSSHSSSPNSPNLGKHSREGNILCPANSQKEKPDKESSNSENSVLIPKTLRIDDPSEAAKSSKWSILGMKDEKADSANGIGFFKAFPSKWDGKNPVVEASPVLQVNPAAWSRSLTFQERT